MQSVKIKNIEINSGQAVVPVDMAAVKSVFFGWLSENHGKKVSPASVTASLDSASELFINRKISDVPIWEIVTPEIYTAAHKSALKDKLFCVLMGRKGLKFFNKCSQLYFDFLKTKPYLETTSNLDTINNNLTTDHPCRTIKEAIVSVLNTNNQGLTSKQIYEKIEERDLYKFGAQNPQNVVRVTLDEACEGSGFTRRAPINIFRFERNENGEKIYFQLQEKSENDNFDENGDLLDTFEQDPLNIGASIASNAEPLTDETGIEAFLINADISGRFLQEIAGMATAFNCKINATRKYLEGKCWAVSMPNNRYIHRDCIIDIDEAAQVMLRILKMQFAMFGGYTSYTAFFEAVQIELSMFLNDNDFNDAMIVYFLARHLFSVENYDGCNFVFYNNAHIWETEPRSPKSNLGVLMTYIKNSGGKVTKEECAAYLDKIKIPSSWNTNGHLQIGTNKDVFQYNPVEYVLAETISINDFFLKQIEQNLDLASEEHPYIILRAMNQNWFERLPPLPVGLDWGYLLLQEIIEKHIPQYRTISALGGQDLNTVKAGVVHKDSPINTLADLVYAYIVTKKEWDLPKTFATEELREKLRCFGMIEGNELIYNMHKALNDRRFVWKDENGSVTILAK